MYKPQHVWQASKLYECRKHSGIYVIEYDLAGCHNCATSWGSELTPS